MNYYEILFLFYSASATIVIHFFLRDSNKNSNNNNTIIIIIIIWLLKNNKKRFESTLRSMLKSMQRHLLLCSVWSLNWDWALKVQQIDAFNFKVYTI